MYKYKLWKVLVLACMLAASIGFSLMELGGHIYGACACSGSLIYWVPRLGCRISIGDGEDTYYANSCPAPSTRYTSLEGNAQCAGDSPGGCTNNMTIVKDKIKYTITGSACKVPCPPCDPGSCAWDEETVGTHNKSNQCKDATQGDVWYNMEICATE